MDREKLMERVHDLQSRMKSAYTEVMKHMQETVRIDFDSIDDSSLLSSTSLDRIEEFVEDTKLSLDDRLARCNVRKGRSFTDGSFYLESELVSADGEMTLAEYVKENVSRNYQDSLLIDSLGESDDFIMSLVDELEADYNLDEARLEQEFSNFEELIEDTKKAAENLKTAVYEIDMMNEDLLHEFQTNYTR